MNIGIIGKGKMGKDIFNHFLQYDYKLTLICRKAEDIDPFIASVEKQLKKMLKLGFVTEDVYLEKKQSYMISDKLDDLKECNVVIESVYEDRELKKELFSKLEAVVKPNCILATNTSSIPLNIIFEKCALKNRCLGLHFFFPIKVTKTVEINKTSFTDEECVNQVEMIIKSVDKKPLILDENVNMILSKTLLNLTCEIHRIFTENYLDINEIDRIVKKDLMTFGLFEIVDSTGIGIILESLENFISNRNTNLYNPFRQAGNKLIQEGYGGGTGNKGFSIYYEENTKKLNRLDEIELEKYKKNVILRLQSLIINEMAYVVNTENINIANFNEAIQEVLGLSETPIDMLKSIGKQKVTDCLAESLLKYEDMIYQSVDLSKLVND